MTREVELCAVEAVPEGDMITLQIEGREPLAIYNIDGDIFVTSAFCTHNIAILTDGYLDGYIVECPLHGGAFDIRTGDPVSEPCEEPIQTFKSTIRDGRVFVFLPEG